MNFVKYDIARGNLKTTCPLRNKHVGSIFCQLCCGNFCGIDTNRKLVCCDAKNFTNEFTAVLVKVNDNIIPVTPQNGTDFTLSELQGFVNGYIEIVATDDYIAVVNEEGFVYNLEPNRTATLLLSQPIVGDVLFCKHNMVK